MINEKRSEPNVRITRGRAKALGRYGSLPPLYPLAAKKDGDRILRVNTKRAASGDKKPGSGCPKKRAVLKDVTNIASHNAGKDEHSKQYKEVSLQKKGNTKISQVQVDKIECITAFINRETLSPAGLILTNANHKDEKLNKKEENLDDRDVTDIDSKHNDPQMCSLYASDIYYNLYAMELARRPLVDYMEKVQRDINQDMRAILIDWLVEVSDEYKMVPDTLYLTVNLIDRFLSENYIEKQRLQLLGVTCMLIATKYEEICVPRVEEFCFITDYTYTKEEVVKMESRVLKLLHFQLSVPTTKKFLRRFIQAAQVSYEVPSAELELLANYLAELTLVEYNFLKFLPSLIAASAVFLARWTLDQSHHPWNPTLEHYTRYKTSELISIVLALQELQENAKGCVHKAIREKYKQSKFKCVSTLRSSKPVQSLF
ncbi:hypothetical protein OROMI_008744 [Orobanche minor]